MGDTGWTQSDPCCDLLAWTTSFTGLLPSSLKSHLSHAMCLPPQLLTKSFCRAPLIAHP